MEAVYIGLGSNLGASAQALLECWRLLGRQDGVALDTLSDPFISSPVGMTSNYWFTNAVGRLRVSGSPGEFLALLLSVERRFGRVRGDRKQGYQDRVIDLDLLYFGSVVVDTPRLTVPHPRRADRLFVLAPLAAIAPDFVDPETGMTIGRMRAELAGRIEAGAVDPQEISRSSWPETP